MARRKAPAKKTAAPVEPVYETQEMEPVVDVPVYDKDNPPPGLEYLNEKGK